MAGNHYGLSAIFYSEFTFLLSEIIQIFWLEIIDKAY